METGSIANDIQRYGGILRRWAWLIILAACAAGAIAFWVSKRSTPVYEAVTTVLINEAPATRSTDYTSIVTSERLAQTYSQLMTKQPVLESLITQSGIDLDVDQLKGMITVQPVQETTLIEVRVEDIDPSRAAEIANRLVDEFSKSNQELQASRYAASKESLARQMEDVDRQIQAAAVQLENLGKDDTGQAERDRIETNLAQYRQTYANLLQSYEQVRLAEAQSTANVIQVEPAVIPERPVRPRVLINTLLAMIVGFMLAVGIAFLVEAMDDTLKGPDQVTGQLGLPVLGMILRHNVQDGRPITLVEPRSQVAEAFRSLRTNLQFTSVDHPLRTLLVTSPTPAEGKSTVAVNLGVVMAQGGKRVALVDADLRRPRVHKLLDIPNLGGISNLFVQEPLQLDGRLQKTSADDLFALTSGELPPNPAELLGSEKMYEIIRLVKEQAEVVIIDSPPVIAVTDSSLLSQRVDGVLLVFKPGVTQMSAARQTVEQLQRLGANLLGAVINEIDLKRSRYYNYHYKGYYYGGRSYYGASRGGIFSFFHRNKSEPDKINKPT